MSDMIINDSVPVNKKWNELLRYNIFIMKLVEFGISLAITLLPLIIPQPRGHMYCISTGPTVVISFLFVILYLRRKVPLFMEKMYLFFQILFTFGAFIQCFLLNLVKVWLWLIYGVFYFALLTVISFLCMLIPFVLDGAAILHCLAVAPTLILSTMFIILYLIDQMHYLAEQLYLLIQIALNVAAFVESVMSTVATGSFYGLFYCHLLVALCIDQYCVCKERGFSLS